MNIARIVVLIIALERRRCRRLSRPRHGRKIAPAAEPVAQLPTVEILVAKSDIGLGQSVKPEDLQWQTWPASTASNNLVNRASRAEAINEIAGSIARAPFIAGEPIREQKLVKANGSGFMAAILPTGMRAISTEISPETGAGGFILPNDRVDVILSKREKNPDGKGARRRPVAKSFSPISACWRSIRRRRKKRASTPLVGRTVDAGTEARAGRDAGACAPERHAVARAAQHHRRQRDGRKPVRRPDSRSEARASTWFATGSPIKRRHRSDRKDVRDEVWGKSVSDANRSGARPVVVGRRRADARSAAAPSSRPSPTRIP